MPAACLAAALTLGPGIEDRDLGPLMNEGAVRKQEEHVADALARGARLLTGGSRDNHGPLFYKPTVLADVPPDALIFHEETFGPVAAIAPFDTEDEAIAVLGIILAAYESTKSGKAEPVLDV